LGGLYATRNYLYVGGGIWKTVKKILLIGGRVHDVGYRPFLLGVAESLGIRRFFADNTFVKDKECVEVLIDDEEDKVKAFIDVISGKCPENAVLDKIEQEDYEGPVMNVESYFRYLNAMQLSRIATYGGRMLEKQDSMLEKQDSMLEKQDSMLEKQDSMLEKQDSMLEKQDIMIQKQDETISIIREESDKTREVIREESDKTREVIREESDKTREVIREESDKTREVIREESIKTREVVSSESRVTRESITDTLEEGFEGVKREHVKTRELSKEIFYTEVRELRQELQELRGAVEEIKKKVGI
jgi:acylphosphatase